MGNERTDKIFHTCDICNKEFSTKSSFVRHKAIHTGDKPFVCDVCGKAFGERHNLKNHQAVHFGKKEFGCNFCGTFFNHSSTLKNHLVLHTGEKPYSCDICRKAFAHRSSLSNHIALIHDTDKPFTCKICKKQFSVERLLEAHISLHEKKMFDCKICNKRVSKRSALKEHMLLHTGEKPHSCVHCNKMFTTKTTLKAHERIHTGETVPCDICGKKLTTKRTMRKHMLLMHQKKDYEWCYICQQTFEHITDLKIHMMVHSTQDTAQKGEKVGDIYVFPAQRSLLKRNISQKLFPCTVCDKKFDNPVDLKIHMMVGLHTVQERDCLSMRVTEMDVLRSSPLIVESDTSLLKQNISQKKMFPCTVCDKTFDHPVDFKIHMMVHTAQERDRLNMSITEKNVLPSSPPLIAKSDTSLLKQNISQKKLFPCTVCDKSFDHPVDLKIHMMYYVHAVQERDCLSMGITEKDVLPSSPLIVECDKKVANFLVLVANTTTTLK